MSDHNCNCGGNGAKGCGSNTATMDRRSFLRKSTVLASGIAAIVASLAPLRELSDYGSVDAFLQKHYKEMTPAEIVRYGQRKYYGYVLEVSLRDPANPAAPDRLQDALADPPELANFAREMPIDPTQPPPDNAADASLFPK